MAEDSTTFGTFKQKSNLKKYSREENDSITMTQCKQLYELQKKVVLIKGKKTQDSIRALEARMAMLEAKTDNSSNESLFQDEKPKTPDKVM